jgi:hypothetical protein
MTGPLGGTYRTEADDDLRIAQAWEDRRVLVAGAWVGVLLSAGVIVSFATSSPFGEYSFSARVTFLYLPVAAIAILLLGHARFPLAAALFFGFIPLAHATSETWVILGDVEGALTAEMVLAVPLLFHGILGPPGRGGIRGPALPPALTWGIWLIVATAILATLLSRDPAHSAWTLLARFLVPVGVMVAVYRRLGSVADYKVVWFGFALSLLAIAVFGYRRAVLGVDTHQIGQRFLGLTLSTGSPSIFVIGGALWLAYAQSEAGRMLRAIFWFVVVAIFITLMWLSASRGPVAAAGLVVAWWAPKRALRTILRPKVLLFFSLGAAVVVYVVRYSLARTELSLEFLVERFSMLLERGLTGEARWRIWMEGLAHWVRSPLWGLGPNSWLKVNPGIASIHGSFAGLLFDVGLFGLFAWALFLGSTLVHGRAKLVNHLPMRDQQFFFGCRAGWTVYLMLMMVELPFTSGQPKNNIFAYVILMFPLLVMILLRERAALGLRPADARLLFEPASYMEYGAQPQPQGTRPGRGVRRR